MGVEAALAQAARSRRWRRFLFLLELFDDDDDDDDDDDEEGVSSRSRVADSGNVKVSMAAAATPCTAETSAAALTTGSVPLGEKQWVPGTTLILFVRRLPLLRLLFEEEEEDREGDRTAPAATQRRRRRCPSLHTSVSIRGRRAEIRCGACGVACACESFITISGLSIGPPTSSRVVVAGESPGVSSMHAAPLASGRRGRFSCAAIEAEGGAVLGPVWRPLKVLLLVLLEELLEELLLLFDELELLRLLRRR